MRRPVENHTEVYRLSSYLVNLGQSLHFWPVQHPQRQADHLEILASRRGGDVARLRPDVKYDALLQPGDEEVCALVDDLLLDSAEPVEDDGPRATLDVVNRRLQQADADGGGECRPVDEAHRVRHLAGCVW